MSANREMLEGWENYERSVTTWDSEHSLMSQTHVGLARMKNMTKVLFRFINKETSDSLRGWCERGGRGWSRRLAQAGAWSSSNNEGNTPPK